MRQKKNYRSANEGKKEKQWRKKGKQNKKG